MQEKMYWNGNGKYQEESDKINDLMPGYGYTDNDYMNLFISISNIYSRVYNDGDSFIEFDEKIGYITPFEKDICFDKHIDYSGQELEELVDRVVEFIKDKNLSFKVIPE